DGIRDATVTGVQTCALPISHREVGKLTVLAARMNPDLSMGDELLKKTGAANLFMVFGEPDIKISTDGIDGNLTVEVRGVDVYDRSEERRVGKEGGRGGARGA